MRNLILLSCFLMASSVSAQNIQSMSFDQLEKKLHERNDQVVLLNFWATWCKPCVEELPDLENLNEKYSGQKIKVILVNLDFTSKLKSVVEPFILNKNLKSEIWHITDTDPNTWINRIDSTWSGAIPATIMYDSSHRKIFKKEGPVTFQELEKIIRPFIR